jgi:hypothetical protein
MKKYFAKLDGDIVGIDTYIRFEDKDMESAQQTAEMHAEEHYGGYEDPYDEEDSPRFYADVEEYDKDKHDKYFSGINTGGEFEILR